MSLEKFIERKIPGINVLSAGTPTYLPGILIDSRKDDIRAGHLKEIFTEFPQQKWAVDRMEGNLLFGENITGSIQVDADISFLSIFKLKSGVKREYEIDFSIDNITASELLNTSRIEIDRMFDELKKTDRPAWRRYKKLTYVLEAFYANSFSVTFKRNGEVSAKAEVENDFDLSAEASFSWEQSGVIRVSQNSNVPFGIRGYMVRD